MASWRFIPWEPDSANGRRHEGPHVDRGMWLLDRLRTHEGAGNLEVLAVELHGIRGPDGLQHLQGLVRAFAPACPGDTDRFELLGQPADAEAHPQPPAREHVQRGQLARQQGRVVPGEVQHARPERHAGGVPGDEGQGLQRVQHRLEHVRVGAIADRVGHPGPDGSEQPLPDPETVVAEGLGASGDRNEPVRARGGAVLWQAESQAHGASSLRWRPTVLHCASPGQAS